jgi:hypothetical protein
VIFPHLASNTVERLIDRRIHILAFETSFDGDLIAAAQNHLNNVSVFLNVQRRVNLDNPWILDVEAGNLRRRYSFIAPVAVTCRPVIRIGGLALLVCIDLGLSLLPLHFSNARIPGGATFRFAKMYHSLAHQAN